MIVWYRVIPHYREKSFSSMGLQTKAFENIVGKGESAGNSSSHNAFFPI